MLLHSSPKLNPGDGQICLQRSSGLHPRASFSTLSFCYPLKLIVPTRHFLQGLQCVYLISYGGGMVAGDQVRLDVKVMDASTLVILTQGSTKIFRLRRGHFPTSHSLPKPTPPTTSLGSITPTRQSMTVTISPRSTLILLPSPVTCFASSSYVQTQSFDLASDHSSNLILLDWYTSGRSAMDSESIDGDRAANSEGEEWLFERYESRNVIRIGDKVVVKDVLLLQDEGSRYDSTARPDPTAPSDQPRKQPTSYLPRVAPYSIYATLVLFGPRTRSIRTHLARLFSDITQYNQSNPYSLIWSFTELEAGQGGILRIASASTEECKEWIQEVLQSGGIEELMGMDLWAITFS